VRRASVVLLIIAVVSGLVFNAFTLLIPKLMQERLANAPHLLPVVGALAFAVTVCGALTQFVLGRLIDRITLKRIFLPLAFLMASGLVALAVAPGWLVLPLTAAVAIAVFGQVLVNETMTARYFSPALRLRMYSLRFFLGFLGSSVAAPLVGLLHQRTGTLAAVTLVLAAVASIAVACALYFPDRPDELSPGLAPVPA
jgi:MFS family permease